MMFFYLDPNQEDFPVQMEGEFEFICGTIESFDPRENFTVRVAPFSFPIPEKFT
jgi:hypothetical protein